MGINAGKPGITLDEIEQIDRARISALLKAVSDIARAHDFGVLRGGTVISERPGSGEAPCIVVEFRQLPIGTFNKNKDVK